METDANQKVNLQTNYLEQGVNYASVF